MRVSARVLVPTVLAVVLVSCQMPGVPDPDDDGNGGDAVLQACIEAFAAGLDPDAPYAALELELAVACMALLHTEQGRADLVWDETLHVAAREHACDMGERDFFAHDNPDGLSPNDRARAAGYGLPEHYPDGANNIESIFTASHPQTSAQQAFDGWLGSPPHRAHVLAENDFYAEQEHVAVGYCENTDATYRHYWVFLSAPTPVVLGGR